MNVEIKNLNRISKTIDSVWRKFETDLYLKMWQEKSYCAATKYI